MHKSATKCNETVGKWCKNKHGASKIIDTFETYQSSSSDSRLMNGTGLRTVLNRPTLRGLLEPLPDLLKVKEVGVGVDALLLGSSHHGHLMRRRLDLPRYARPGIEFLLWQYVPPPWLRPGVELPRRAQEVL
jgi:hypothetical protein